jgi:hypothetical protein
MKWITRENAKVDRIACPWLIKRFIDEDAEFLFATKDKALSEAERHRAIPFEEEVKKARLGADERFVSN